MTHFSWKLSWLLLLALSYPVSAEVIEGMVTGIADGDTLYVLDKTRNSHKIRLLGIDAPEHGQAFGERSKQSLANMAYRKVVSVDWQSRDIYGRILGKVRVVSENCRQQQCSRDFDVNLEQLRLGLAWWNKKFSDTQLPGDALAYEKAEREARKAKAGLWVQLRPMPPWRWRYANRAEQDKVEP